MNCYVPYELELLLTNLAPTNDPQRRLQLFVPSLAAFDFQLDFGRCVPPSMFILAHNLLASTRSNADPETVLRIFYSTQILRNGDVTYIPANFLGGYFDRNARPTNHSNWLNFRFEKLFNPVIGRALIQRPTLAKTRLVPQFYPDMNALNAYDFLLCYSESNIEKMFEIISYVSSFFKAEKCCQKVLSQVL